MEDHTQLLIGLMQKTIEEFQRKFFGSSSEKTGRKNNGEEPVQEVGKVTVKSHTRKRNPKSKREELYKNLPVREVRCPVPGDSRLCPDCDMPMETVAQKGAPLARETAANWCIKCALEYFQPVYDLLHGELLKRGILHADETVCQVLHEEGKTAVSKSYLWIYLTGNDGLAPIILYEYQPGRQGEYARSFLEGFRGPLECDGYTGYNRVENVILVCCPAHCRRYLFEAIPAARRRKIKLLDINSPEEIPAETADPEKAKKQQQPAAEIGLCLL